MIEMPRACNGRIKCTGWFIKLCKRAALWKRANSWKQVNDRIQIVRVKVDERIMAFMDFASGRYSSREAVTQKFTINFLRGITV